MPMLPSPSKAVVGRLARADYVFLAIVRKRSLSWGALSLAPHPTPVG